MQIYKQIQREVCMAIFDIFRSGYNQGYQHGSRGERRRAEWELMISNPLVWIPGVDSQSFLNGYVKGYSDSMMTRSVIHQFNNDG